MRKQWCVVEGQQINAFKNSFLNKKKPGSRTPFITNDRAYSSGQVPLKLTEIEDIKIYI